MSNIQGDTCFGCGGRFNFLTYHLPHCEKAKGKTQQYKAAMAGADKDRQNTSSASVGR